MFDASGNPVRSPYLVREPVTGATVKLTLDANLQKVAQDAIYRGMQIAHADQQYYAELRLRRRDQPRERGDLRDGVVSDLQADGLGAAVRRAGQGRRSQEPALPAGRQVVRGHVSARVDVQADHGGGGLDVGADRARIDPRPAPPRSSRRTTSATTSSSTGAPRTRSSGSRRRSRSRATPSSTGSATSSTTGTRPARTSSRSGSASSATATRLAVDIPGAVSRPRARPAVEGAQPALRERPQPVDRHPLGAG